MNHRRMRSAKKKHGPRIAPTFLVPVLISLSLLPRPTHLSAQTVQGHLTDARTKFTVAVADLALRDSTGTIVVRTSANYLGFFRITAPAPGVFSLRVEAMGYGATDSEVFELRVDETTTLDLVLTPNPVELDTLAVETRRERIVAKLEEQGFYERQRQGAGTFLTPEQIRRWPAINVVDILEHAPFVHIDRRGGLGEVRITLRKYFDVKNNEANCEPEVYVDERKLPPLWSVEYAVEPEDVVAVEVYRGISQIPLRWAGHETCGVILIWTRFGREN